MMEFFRIVNKRRIEIAAPSQLDEAF